MNLVQCVHFAFLQQFFSCHFRCICSFSLSVSMQVQKYRNSKTFAKKALIEREKIGKLQYWPTKIFLISEKICASEV